MADQYDLLRRLHKGRMGQKGDLHGLEGFTPISGPNPPTEPQGPPPQYTRSYVFWQNLTGPPASDLLCLADGFAGPRKVLVSNTGTGSFGITPLGSDDGNTWFQVPYRVSATATPNTVTGAGVAAPTEAVGPYNVAADVAAMLILDMYYTWYRFTMGSIVAPIIANGVLTLVPVT